MRFAVIENGVTVNIAVGDAPLDKNWVASEHAAIGDLFSNGAFHKPKPVPPPTPRECTALQGLLALSRAGLANAFEAWANNPARTFEERAFINRAILWRRDDPVLAAGARALGLTEANLDQLFLTANTLERV